MPNNTNITHLPTDETLAAGLAGIANALGATVDSAMSSSSENAVQNKVVKAYVDANKGTQAFVCNMTLNQGQTALVADKTFAEIKAAADNSQYITMNADIADLGISQTLYPLAVVRMGNQYSVFFLNTGNGDIEMFTGSANEYPTIAMS